MKLLVKLRYLIAPVGFSLAVLGCTPYALLPADPQPVITLGHKVNLNNTDLVLSKLNAQYSEWHGVPYRGGGMSKKGVDCSALVYITFKEKFGLELPRSAQQQAQVGEQVSKSELRPGDLVFFRTQLINRHVGIYMGGNKFMHVSSKKGVMISGMSDYYWANKFSEGRRLR